jgi:hypothetical protein
VVAEPGVEHLHLALDPGQVSEQWRTNPIATEKDSAAAVIHGTPRTGGWRGSPPAARS